MDSVLFLRKSQASYIGISSIGPVKVATSKKFVFFFSSIIGSYVFKGVPTV